MATPSRKTSTILASDLTDRLTAEGLAVQLHHTGGGTGTLVVDTQTPTPVLIGPGVCDGTTPPTFNTDDLYVGPDWDAGHDHGIELDGTPPAVIVPPGADIAAITTIVKGAVQAVTAAHTAGTLNDLTLNDLTRSAP